MDEAIEIVKAMYDEAMAHYNKIPSFIMASEATVERIDTLEEVRKVLDGFLVIGSRTNDR